MDAFLTGLYWWAPILGFVLVIAALFLIAYFIKILIRK